MKRISILLILVMIVTVLVACEKTTTKTDRLSSTISSTNPLSSTSPQTSLPPVSQTTTTTTSLTTVPTTDVTTVTITSAIPSKVTEELSIHSTLYGNTNGNANNQGLVVYDRTNKLHYYALGPSVYTYNPATNSSNVLFTLTNGGNVRNLTLSDTYLYFVSTQDQYFHKYNLQTQVITTVFEGETYKTYRYSSYVFIDANNITYQKSGLRKYYQSNETFSSSWGYDATNVNISGLKIYYTVSNGPSIELMADTFGGKTTVVNFTNENFIEIKELLLLNDGDSKSFALIGRTSSEEALYLYNTASGLEKITVSIGTGMRSINTNGTHLYFINGSNLYSLNLSTKDLVLLKELNGNFYNINIINHWIYFSNLEMTSLYRIHPDTLEIIEIIS